MPEKKYPLKKQLKEERLIDLVSDDVSDVETVKRL
jgi:hypothetical protein